MAGTSSVIVVRVLGNTKGLTRSLAKAQSSLGGLERISNGITSAMRVAGIAALAFGASAVAGAAVGAAALAAIPALLLGIGIAFAAQNQKVRAAFSGLKSHVVGVMRDITRPLVGPLVNGAHELRKAFDTLVPTLRSIFKAAAPLLNQVFAQMVPLARQLGPLLRQAFGAGTPVFLAFVNGLRPVMAGFREFFAIIGRQSSAFTGFMASLMTGLGQLLPAFGRLLAALAPIGTVVLQTIIPALVSLLNWLSAHVGPAFQAVSGFFAEHQTAAKAVGIALLGLVIAVKAVQTAMALASATTLIFTGVAKTVRAAIIVWKNAQLALNLAMMLNPIGLVIAAIVALVAVFVIAWKKSDTFRRIVTKAWDAIKRATTSVWGFIRGFFTRLFSGFQRLFSATWSAIRRVVASITNTVRNVITTAWNYVRSKTREAWQAVVGVVRDFIARLLERVRGIKDRVRGALANAGSWLLSAGRDLIRGLINGVGDMAGALVSKVGGVVGGAISHAKNLLGIGSPSKLFRQFGRWTTEGLVIGLKETAGLAARAATGLAGQVARGFEAPNLTLNARPALTGSAAAGAATGARTYQITVQVPVGASSADIGRELVKHIETYEQLGGRRRA